jgi:UDP-N-acetylglucosamine 4,6-dehydratase/5-epimerase
VTYLITGGTGTLGKNLTKYLLATIPGCKIRVYSRDEQKQWEMATDIKNDTRVSFILGDVRDSERIAEACDGADFVVHAAAYKHIASAENHPWQVIKTNVEGTKNVVAAANKSKAIMVLVSTDKAVQPTTLYGATKMAAEAITLNGKQRVVRYGNVFGSRGSVLHKFKEWAAKGHTFKITDYRMTRFVLTVDKAIDLVMDTLDLPPGTLNVPTLPAMRIVDLAKAFDPEASIEEIGIQPGEKLHEALTPEQTSDRARMLTIEEIRELIDAAV